MNDEGPAIILLLFCPAACAPSTSAALGTPRILARPAPGIRAGLHASNRSFQIQIFRL